MDSMTFFAFPLNLILALIWLLAVCMSYKHAGGSRIVRFMLSPAASIIAIALLAAFCMVIGLSGNRNLTRSWPFVITMLFFMTVLAFVLVRGWKSGGKPRWRFILNHAGLLLAVSSAFWGAPDSETLRFQAFMDTPVREAYRMDGSRAWLPCEVELKDFEVRLSDDGTPSYFAAEVVADGKQVVLTSLRTTSRRSARTSRMGMTSYLMVQAAGELVQESSQNRARSPASSPWVRTVRQE